MKEEPLVSIIVPVYNIVRCKTKFLSAVNSVLKQSYLNVELILVNDGSKDDSSLILDKLRKEDPRIVVITKDNGGVESARREGLRHVRGWYILHMDQDDIYDRNAIKRFVEVMEETEADVVVANNTRFFLNNHFTFGTCKTPAMTSAERVIEHEEFMQKYYRSFFGINDLPVNIWNKMYRRTFIESVPTLPITGHIIEDLSYNMHILPYARKIAILPDILYYYRWGGFTNRYDKTILATALTGYRLKMQQIVQWQMPQFKHSTAVELLNYLNTYFSQCVSYDVFNREQFLEEARRLFSIEEVDEASNIVKEYDKYHREYIDAMLDRDFVRLYNYELLEKNRTKYKRIIKKILLRL